MTLPETLTVAGVELRQERHGSRITYRGAKGRLRFRVEGPSSDEAGRGVRDWGGVWHITYEAAGHTDTEVLPGSAGDTPEAAAQVLDGIVRSFAATFAGVGS